MTIEHYLNCYEQSLLALETATSPQIEPVSVLDVLAARDALQQILADGAKLSGVQWFKLNQLDERLKQQKEKIIQNLSLEQWRETVQPSESAWWWYCDPPKPQHWSEKYDWAFNGLNLALLTASVSLVVDTSSKFLVGGLGLFGSAAIATQSILTLIAGGGSLTQVGQKVRQQIFNSFNVKEAYWEEISTIAAFVLLLSLIGFRVSLPRIAVLFNQWGVEHYLAREFNSALSDYQQAIALRPDYADAHYNLGLIYEDLQQYDKARAEYQLAIQSDLNALEPLDQLKAHNNLGRLYILKKDYTAAIPSLITGINLIDEEAAKTDQDLRNTQYALYKNLGWTQLGLKNYTEAESKLQQAIRLDPERGAAYCLLAQVLEGKQQQTEALTQWKNCSQYVKEFQPDEYQWLALARDKTANQGKQP